MFNIKNLNSIPHSDTLAINEISKSRIASGEQIYRFGFGQSPFSPPHFLIEELKNNACEHDYLEVQGLRTLRENVAKFHSTKDLTINPHNVHIAPGSKMLLFSIIAAFKQAAVILPAPCWVSYMPQAKLLAKDCFFIQTTFDNRWRVNAKDLKNLLNEQNIDDQKQKILILTSPGNPESLIYDKIYSLLTFNQNYNSIIEFYPEMTIVTNGLSKWCGAGGWRLGICYYSDLLKKDITKALNGIGSETFSSVAAPIQYAAIKAYQKTPEINDFIELEKKVLIQAANLTSQILKNNSKIKFHNAQGGFYLFLDFSYYKEAALKNDINNIKDFCSKIFTQTGVALLPSTAFGMSYSSFAARMAFVDFDGKKALKEQEEKGEVSKQTFLKLKEGCLKICNWLKQLV